jgi:hypothetical protein
MDEQKASAISARNGSLLLNYELGRSAFLLLASGEQVVISIGTVTTKVFVRRAIVGWRFPKTIASQPINAWQPTFLSLDKLRRFACGCMVLDGLVDLVSRCRSLSELRMAWPALRNPIEVAAGHMI